MRPIRIDGRLEGLQHCTQPGIEMLPPGVIAADLQMSGTGGLQGVGERGTQIMGAGSGRVTGRLIPIAPQL